MIKKTYEIKNIVMLHILFFLYSFTGFIAKCASNYSFMSRKFVILYVLNLMILVIYAFFWQKIIKSFDVSIAYSNKAIVLVWTLIWSIVFFGEKITKFNILGIGIIIIGILVVVNDEK